MSELDEVLAENRRLQAEAEQRAARLEAHTKTVQRWVLIDGAARDDIGDEFKLTQMEDQMFKGKSESVRVYAVDR